MNQGEILQADNPSGIYNFPSSVFVARFIGRPPMNLLQVKNTVSPGTTRVAVDGQWVAVPMLEAHAERALLGVRPEHVHLGAPDTGLAARVKHVEYFGSHWIAELESAAGTLKAVVDKKVRPTEGDQVGLGFDTQRIVLFDAGTERLLQSVTTSSHRPSMSHG
jgi:multiple sugar transport system ATP-binding protein